MTHSVRGDTHMPIAWIVGAASEEEHDEFVREFRRVAGDSPYVRYIDSVPALPKDPKEFRALCRQWRARYRPNCETVLVTQWPSDFDDDGTRICELLNFVGSMVYILDDRDPWPDVFYCAKRRAGQSVREFVESVEVELDG